MELQEKLTRHRKEKGLSQMEVAEELGVSRQTVSRWETGDGLILFSAFFRFCSNRRAKRKSFHIF